MIGLLGGHLKAVAALVISALTAAVGWVLLLVTSATVVPVIGAVLAAALAAGSTWWVAVRKSSGKIETSEAADLWREGQAIRRELRDEAERLRNRVRELEAREDELEGRVRTLEQEKRDLEVRVRQLEATT